MDRCSSATGEACDEQSYTYSKETGKPRTELNDVIYEFSSEAMPWTEAGEACEKRGGRLLWMLSCELRDTLKAMTVERGRRSQAWWVGQSLMGRYEENPLNGKDNNCGGNNDDDGHDSDKDNEDDNVGSLMRQDISVILFILFNYDKFVVMNNTSEKYREENELVHVLD